jgi:hypothetical protein
LIKLTKVSLCLATLALGVASAASSYSVVLTSNTWVGNTELKPGEYKLQVEANQATFKRGKVSAEVPVTVENSANKFSNTSLNIESSKLQSIDLGGTKTKIVLAPAKSTGSEPAAH